jgi:NADH-quinone oxidoreductase subunit C
VPPDPPAGPRGGDSWGADPLLGELQQELGEAIVAPLPGAAPVAGDLLTVEVRREDVARVAALLCSRFRYTFLVDLCAADYPARARRFEVVYHLYSFRENRRLRLKTRAGEGEAVPSVTAVWRGADWPEREAHEMLGVDFSGHPDLAPLLLWEGFAGHPLRKDFPLAGRDTGAALLDAGVAAVDAGGAAAAVAPAGEAP